MLLKQISLVNFRNYEKESVFFHEKVNLIMGKNAQGKTNLLESLYMMSLGKSFRTAKDVEMIRFDEEFCKIKSTSLKDNRDLDIEIVVAKEGKQIKIDGLRCSKNADLLEHVYMVVFSPEDLKIVKDEPEKRRKFIDRELCQLKPVYYQNLARYKKILQQRNKLLKEQVVKEEMLAVWDEGLAEYGAKIILERAKFIEKLNQISREINLGITNGKESLSLSYESSLPCCADFSAQKQLFLQKLAENHKKDLLKRTTSCGPHKDDLKIAVENIDIRHFGSQGQQRTAALSLKLAEIRLIKEETGEDPILLLDDVLSELDLERQRFLIHSLSNVQLFITTTELSVEMRQSLPQGFTFFVENGVVKREDETRADSSSSPS